MVSLLQILEKAEYDFTTLEDCQWLVSVKREFEELVDEAEDTIYNLESETEL